MGPKVVYGIERGGGEAGWGLTRTYEGEGTRLGPWRSCSGRNGLSVRSGTGTRLKWSRVATREK